MIFAQQAATWPCLRKSSGTSGSSPLGATLRTSKKARKLWKKIRWKDGGKVANVKELKKEQIMSSTKVKQQAGIPELVRAEIQNIEENAQVILFGSRARGDNRKDSDWDFLILMDREVTVALKDEIRERLYEIELETGEVISTIIHQKDEWEERTITPIYQIIEEEGVEV